MKLEWIIWAVILVVFGAFVGIEAGESKGQAIVADACKTSGAFHYKRTGFKCERFEK